MIVLAMVQALIASVLFFSKCSRDPSCHISYIMPEPNLTITLTANYQLNLHIGIYLDPLAAMFILLAAVIASFVAICSFNYLFNDKQNAEVAGYFSLFLLSILLVFLMSNGFWLLVALEAVTFTALPLLLYRFRAGESSDKSGRAIETYLNVSHLSNLILLVSILILGDNFHSLQLITDHINPIDYSSTIEAQIGFILAFSALCIRCGVVPFQDWVAVVHPQMPTNLHALVSSIMLKIPIYLMVRFFFQYFDNVAWVWGALLVLLAAATAYLSVWSALVSNNLKKILAFHSTENIGGLCLFGIGLALLMRNLPIAGPELVLQGIAAAALTASLYHVVNHGLFKALLFLGVASIERSYGTFDEEQIRMVIARLPWTGVSFLIGSLSIIGVPGLNGFASKALLFFSFVGAQQALSPPNPSSVVSAQQALFSKDPASIFLTVLLPLSLVLLALAFALTLVAIGLMAKSILFTPTQEQSKKEYEPLLTRFVLASLAAICVVIGLLPGGLIQWFKLIVQSVGFGANLAQGDLSQFGFGNLNKASPIIPTAFVIPTFVIPTVTLWVFVLIPLAVALLYTYVRAHSARKVNDPTIGGAPPHSNEPLPKGTVIEPLRSALPFPRIPSLESLLYAIRAISADFSTRFQPGLTSPYVLYLLGFIIGILFLFILFIR